MLVIFSVKIFTVLYSTSCSQKTVCCSKPLSDLWYSGAGTPLKYIVMFLSSSWLCSLPAPLPPPHLPGAVCYGPLSSKHGAQGATAASTPMAAAGDLTRWQLSSKTQEEALGLLKGLWAFINTDDKIFPSVEENRFLSLTLEGSFSFFLLKN